MKESVKKWAFGILKAALVIGIGGYCVLVMSVLFLMGLAPLYVAKVFPWLGGALVLLSAAAVSGLVPKKWTKWMKWAWAAFLVAAIGCGVYIGIGIYNDSIPVMEDRDSLIYEYEPFAEGTRAVYLDEESTLKFDTPTIDMDGATALYPVYSGFVQAVYPDGKYDIYDYKYNEDEGYG